MLVEAAIQDHDPRSDHRSALKPGHADMVTIVVDDRSSDVQPALTLPREMEMLGASRGSLSDDDAG
jgi:hypothetical protein